MPCVMVHTNAVYGNGTAVRQCHETMAQYSLTPGNCTDVPNSGVLDEGGAWPQWIMLQCTNLVALGTWLIIRKMMSDDDY